MDGYASVDEQAFFFPYATAKAKRELKEVQTASLAVNNADPIQENQVTLLTFNI